MGLTWLPDDLVARILALREDPEAPVLTYPVPESVIDQAEAILGRRFPGALRAVWLAVGCGFYHAPIDGGARHDAINCLMSPLDAVDLMQHRRWLGPGANVFPFYNEDDDDHIVLVEGAHGLSVEHEWARGTTLAESPAEFVAGLCRDPGFWIGMLPAA